MKLTLHHINLSTQQVEVMDEFYRDVIGLHTETKGLPVLEKKKDILVMWPSLQMVKFNAPAQDIKAGFKTGHIVNPVAHGHIAYRTDDIQAFMTHLDSLAFPIQTGAIGQLQAGIRFSFMIRMAM